MKRNNNSCLILRLAEMKISLTSQCVHLRLNIAKVNIAVNLYEAGDGPLKVVAEHETRPGQLVDTDYLCGEHFCFQGGHAKLSPTGRTSVE